MTLAAALFDLDGTLTDPKIGITACIRHALKALGQDPPAADDLTWCIGPPLARSFARLLGTDDPALLQAAVDHYRSRYTHTGIYENALYPGIREALTQLQAEGIRLFVATSKATVYAVRVIDHFQLATYFEAVHGSELDGTRADKSELIAHVLREEALEADHTVMIGDREHDMIGGKTNGLRCLGVTYGYGSRAELLASGAERLAEHPSQVAAALMEMAKGH